MSTIRNFPGLRSVPDIQRESLAIGGRREVISLADYQPIHFLELTTLRKTINLFFANAEIEGIFYETVEKIKKNHKGYFELWDGNTPEEVIKTGICKVLGEAIVRENIREGLNREAYIDFENSMHNKEFSITLELFFDREKKSVTIQKFEYIPY